jgi:uncharacterized protein
MHFEWDAAKAAANRRKHGVSFEEAQTVFGDRLTLVGPDEVHSEVEERERAVGRSVKGRLLVLIFTRRGEVFRIINARRATRLETRRHETESAKRLRESEG